MGVQLSSFNITLISISKYMKTETITVYWGMLKQNGDFSAKQKKHNDAFSAYAVCWLLFVGHFVYDRLNYVAIEIKH